MYENELLLNVVKLTGENSATVYVREKGGAPFLTVPDMSVASHTFLLLLGMVSAYNERYHLEKSAKLAKLS